MRSPYGGTNKYRTHLKAGKTIAATIARLKGVVGILGTGSVRRRWGDRFSDLDLIVYARDDAVKEIEELVSTRPDRIPRRPL